MLEDISVGDIPYDGEGDPDSPWEETGYDAIVPTSDISPDVPDDLVPDEGDPATEVVTAEAAAEPLGAARHAGEIATGQTVEGVEPDRTDLSTAASEEEIRKFQTATRRKVYFLGAYLRDGDEPVRSEDREYLRAITQIGTNLMAADHPRSELRRTIKRFYASSEMDPFATQELGSTIVSRLLEGTETFDIPDMIATAKVLDGMLSKLMGELPDQTLDRNAQKVLQLQRAIIGELVHAIQPDQVVGGGVINVRRTFQSLFGIKEEDLDRGEKSTLRIMQEIITDRLILTDMIFEGGLWTVPEDHGDSPYSAPPAPEELNRLNRAAAETIERLHLLQAYGVGPFEVMADQIGLPWDIAVLPPLENPTAEDPRYAPDAVADFILLAPGPREDIALRQVHDDQGVKHIAVGDAETVMRFRLHADGGISHGMRWHNIPSDNTQRSFEEAMGGIAFQRLRALFISLAFDAVVPDEVTRGDSVRGSVAETLREPSSDRLPARILEIVLRRQRALQRARVNRDNRTPEGWEGPKREIGGYKKRVPAGCKPRPTADQEARAYYQSLNISFAGLREGETFVGPYKRRTAAEVKYRRARFRRDAVTRRFMRDLRGGDPGRNSQRG